MRHVICLQLSNHIKNADAYRNNNEMKKLGNFFTRAANLYDSSAFKYNRILF